MYKDLGYVIYVSVVLSEVMFVTDIVEMAAILPIVLCLYLYVIITDTIKRNVSM